MWGRRLDIGAVWGDDVRQRPRVEIRRLERLFTQHFLAVTAGCLAIAFGAFVFSVVRGYSLEIIATLVDTSFKIAAVIVGTAWALNRYFTARTDVLQLRVDPMVETVSSPDGNRLLLCRVDIVNTGKSLTPSLKESLDLHAVLIINDEVTYRPFYRWPADNSHPVAPIEPGSWSAISIAVPLPPDVCVVQVYIHLQFETGEIWTWHRHFTTAPAGGGVS